MTSPSPPLGSEERPAPSAVPAPAARPAGRLAELPARVALVVVWSSGFLSGTLGLRYAAPYTFAALRFALAGLVLLAVAGIRRQRLPRGRRLLHLAVAGVLVQAVQFSSIYAGMDLGVPSGLAALIIALYPLTASLLAVPLLHERVSAGQLLGLVLGLGGVALAVAEGIELSLNCLPGLGFLALGLLGISAGTVYQKRFCGQMDPVSGNAVQLLAASLVVLVPALLAEGWDVHFTAAYWPVLLWSALVNSIVGVGLLYRLLQRHGTSQVSSLFQLVPMSTAGLGALLLGQRLGPLTLAGLVLATAGTLLTHRVRR
ncbi:DMT family transporter [Streptomyces platensis]|uniref:Amino-acid metabolite efflux pump n=1 Tax=Streptomyces platensis TaxID=58346 RepID=A0ABX3XTK9_STRPT|nr:DMT family transporter [Streptomyces platensis]OSY43756.1 putative amino-acid metabolite efflux pump [Streptomyces platensis]